MNKPTGQLGWTKISPEAAEFQPIAFPKGKAEIERFIVKPFLRLAPDTGVFPHKGCSTKQNDESDLDFTLVCGDRSRVRKLELMEVAPLEHLGAYEKAPASYNAYDFAAYILKKAQSKSEKYGRPLGVEQHLLIYVTDWKFILSDSVVSLLQYWTQDNKHNFSGIYIYMPMGQDEGVSYLIFPTPKGHWKTFNPDSFRENVVTNLDPGGWQRIEKAS